MKKRTIIILSIFILCLVCFLTFWWLQPKLINGNKSDLQQIIIIQEPNYAGQSLETVITDKNNLDDLFDAIKNTWTSANRHPSHNDSLQFDSDYKLIFIFSNVTEEIYIHADTAYRFLETRGGSGDPGYIRGSAKEIIEILKNATEDAHRVRYINPIDDYFNEWAKELSGATIEMNVFGENYAASWKEEMLHAYDILLEYANPHSEELQNRIEQSRSTFLDFVENDSYLEGLVFWSDGFSYMRAEVGDTEKVGVGSGFPSGMFLAKAELYKQQTLRLHNMLDEIGVLPEFVFNPNHLADIRNNRTVTD